MRVNFHIIAQPTVARVLAASIMTFDCCRNDLVWERTNGDGLFYNLPFYKNNCRVELSDRFRDVLRARSVTLDR